MKIEQAQERTEDFLTRQMVEALRAVEYEQPRFDSEPQDSGLPDASRAAVVFRHVRGASDCLYLVRAFGDELLMQLQLNVFRFVVVYRVPAVAALDAISLTPRLERWRIGAEHAGWTLGWRDSLGWPDATQRFVETYCYAFAKDDFLGDPLQQLYWRTDIMQMSRAFLLEMQRYGVVLSPRTAGYEL
jgi:hypothetical protein